MASASTHDHNTQGQAEWIELAGKTLKQVDFPAVSAALDKLNEHLKIRTYLSGYQLTQNDVSVVHALRASPIWKKLLQNPVNEDKYANILRWQGFVEADPTFKPEATVQASVANEPKKKDQGSMDIDLVGAVEGQVVTRFPPEPSGYLHIGHAKAALLNEYFARAYKGKLIVRFDDTNPSKEKEEFEHAILEDLQTLGIKPDQITYTSDWFPKLLELAWKMIKEGKAYVDNTEKEEMRKQRMDGIASVNRDASVEENCKRFQEMIDGTEYGQTCCLRAKMSVDAKNKALRDPVMYRYNAIPHNRSGTTYKIYPTYDFACPVVDSLEGVTHALRTNEYHDRNDQFYWFIAALGLRKPEIWDYSRMNFVYTLLSKRKLTWFVDNQLVSGWDDPRFPTIRGILRRGMTVAALKEYILMQGASKNVLLLEWDKFWAVNRKVIDPTSPRHTAVTISTRVPWKLTNGPAQPCTKEVLKNKKNPELGSKITFYSSNILIDGDDAKEVEVNEEVTLMDWGNAFVRKIIRDDHGAVKEIEGELYLEGDFKKTKKKLTWLAQEGDIIEADLLDYDFLITKKKIEDDDKVEDILNPTTRFLTKALVDGNLKTLQKGQFIELQRRGFYICDAPLSSGTLQLILVPDGKARMTETPAKPAKPAKNKDESRAGKQSQEKKVAASPTTHSSQPASSNTSQGSSTVYSVSPLYDMSVAIDVKVASSGMYIVRPAYDDMVFR